MGNVLTILLVYCQYCILSISYVVYMSVVALSISS